MKKVLLLMLSMSFNLLATPFTACDESGMAGIYPCNKIDLMSHIGRDVLGGPANDIWGWTDPLTKNEYALIGIINGTAFIDVTDAKNPVYLGKLKSATTSSIWRDIKTYENYAYIVSEANSHGMQIFDLTQLRNVDNPPIDFTETNRYTKFGDAHNIVINESTGFAYAVGSNTCSAGLHMINLENPAEPTEAGCFSEDGYTHDAQCITYNGPDTEHVGQEICFNSNEDTLTIVDVTDKSNPVQLSKSSYSNSQYTHQGWLAEDHRYYLMGDELDEENNGNKTTTYIWDLLDLEMPQLIGTYVGSKDSIDHNIYIKGKLAYLTSYTSGLSIVDISNIANADLTEVASFDSYPEDDNAEFNGAWSNYPFFESGNIIMSDYDSGLYVLSPTMCQGDSSQSQVPDYCELAVEEKTIQPGLWYDPAHNGHGFVLEPIANTNLYFTVFYTYKDDGTPEWYTSLTTLENGILNVNMDDNTLQRFSYDYSVDPTGEATPLVLDPSVGTNTLSINFNSNQLLSFDACQEQIASNPNTALATWQLGDQSGSWCIVPLINQASYPEPDLGATWWSGADDDGWGLSLAFAGDTIIVVVYYYDAEGKPRWVLGQKTGFVAGQEINVDMSEFVGFARDAAPVALTNTSAGTISLKLNSTTFDLNNDGTMSIDINYQGSEGGNWKRTNLPITNFTDPHK